MQIYGGDACRDIYASIAIIIAVKSTAFVLLWSHTHKIMIYRVLRVLVRLALHVYFRRVIVIDTQNLPLDKPVLISSNHPSSFLEAILLACFLPRPLHFLVRGDVFRNPKFRWFFRATNQVPIYRFRDGFASLRNNARTFDYCYDTLAEGKAILIFSEGSTEMVKRLRPLQKGTARIALGALDKTPDLDLHIVPIGVNFSNPTRFRSDVMVKVGEPLPAKPYYEAYQGDPPGAMQTMTEDLQRLLQPCVVHIPEHIHETQIDPLFTILRSSDRDFKGPFVVKNPARFEAEKALAQRLGDMSPKFFNYLIDKLEKLERLMPRLHFRRPVTLLHRAGWLRTLALTATVPLYLLSVLFFALPWGVAQWVASSKVKVVEFYAPVRLGVATLLSLLWLVLIWVLGGISLPYGWILAPLVFVLMLGLRIYLRDLYLLYRPGVQMQWMHPNRRKKLRNQFDQIFQDVKKLTEKNEEAE